jgi:m7GpppX diphosphatase
MNNIIKTISNQEKEEIKESGKEKEESNQGKVESNQGKEELSIKKTKKIKKQTYEEYLNFIKKNNWYISKRDQWIYNIIDGIAEQDKIIYRDDLCIVIPTYIWDENNIEMLHILCLPLDISLRCIRTLESKDVFLLEHMKLKTLEIIKTKYNLNFDEIKMYFHYKPSTYHLHIHFVNILHYNSGSSIENSHDLDSVIFNLSFDTDYYKKISLNILI